MNEESGIAYPDVTVPISQVDGNVFFLIAAVSRALKRAGHHAAAQQFVKEAKDAPSYDAVLQLIMRTVETE